MSIIEKTNPLNLQFCVCVVLNSSCPLGTIVSKTLLKANALVLGIDSRPKNDSLNAGLGTHFQFQQQVPKEVSSEQVMKIVEDAFGASRMDCVVHVVEDGQEGRVEEVTGLIEGLAIVMTEGGRGKGAIVTAMSEVEDAEDSRLVQVIHTGLASKFGEKGVRCSIVSGVDSLGFDNSAYNDAKEHMHALTRAEKIAKDVPSANEARLPATKLYDVGNVILFLAGDMGENISGAIVARDGSYRQMQRA